MKVLAELGTYGSVMASMSDEEEDTWTKELAAAPNATLPPPRLTLRHNTNEQSDFVNHLGLLWAKNLVATNLFVADVLRFIIMRRGEVRVLRRDEPHNSRELLPRPVVESPLQTGVIALLNPIALAYSYDTRQEPAATCNKDFHGPQLRSGRLGKHWGLEGMRWAGRRADLNPAPPPA
jgi:hypothetical protein